MAGKASNFTIRVEAELAAAFAAACKANDVTASQVLRAAMRDYLARNLQPALPFGGKAKGRGSGDGKA